MIYTDSKALCKPNGGIFTTKDSWGTWVYYLIDGVVIPHTGSINGDDIHPSYNDEEFTLDDFEEELSDFFDVEGLCFSNFSTNARLTAEGAITTLSSLIGYNDCKSFLVNATDLINVVGEMDSGWNFEQDYDELYTEQYQSYEAFVADAEVQIIVYNDRSTSYLIAPKGSDWQNADAHNPTGCDEDTIHDVYCLVQENKIK